MRRFDIQRAEAADYPVIADLAGITWRTCFPGMITEEQIEYMLDLRYTPEAMAHAVTYKKLVFELLRVDDVSRAFAAHGDAGAATEYKLHQLYVHPEWQSQGLGGRLLEHVETIARSLGRQMLVLTVNRLNHRARALYEKRGFYIRESVVVDIGAGLVMDDYVMAKSLKPPAS